MTAARRLDTFDPRTLGAKCDCCPLREKMPVPSSPPEKGLRFAILGEAPGQLEEKWGRVFIGPSGKMLDKFLDDNGLDRDEAWVGNTLLCRPEHEEQFEKARACCTPRLFKELEALPASIPIVTMGKEASKSLLGVGGILKARGFVWKVPTLTDKQLAACRLRLKKPAKKRKGKKATKDKKAKRTARLKLHRQRLAGRTVLPTIHPAFVLRSQIWEAVLRVDMERIARFIQNGNWIKLEDQQPFVVVSKSRELQKLVRKLGLTVAVDIETNITPDPIKKLICVGLGDRKLTIIAYPWKRKMAAVLADAFKTRTVVGHNFICFDAPVLEQHGVEIDPARVEDTMIATHAFASHLPRSLLQVASVFTNASPWKHEAKGDKDEKGKPEIDKLPPDKLVAYNAADVRLTALSWNRMQGDLEPERHIYEIGKRMAAICAEMARVGFPFDLQRCRELDAKLTRRAEKLLKRVRDLTKMHEFNPANPYDVRQALYRKFGAPLLLLTPTGLPATGKTVLEQFRSDDSEIGKLADLVLRWRAAMKTKNTFLSVYVARDGCVHPGWRIGPITGRLSCGNPNLMNLPQYTPDKKTGVVDLCDRVRECYVARPGYQIVYFDLAQAEPRFAAHLSQDPAFMAAVEIDVHAANAKVIFPDLAKKGYFDGKEAKQGKGKPFRDITKNQGMAIYYLAGWDTIYEKLTSGGFSVSPSDCHAIVDAIRGAYTRYFNFVDENVAFVREHGYLRTFGSGRIRWFGTVPDATAVANFPVQAGIADFMNDRLPRLVDRYREEFEVRDVYPIAQVHDSVLTECRTELVDDVKAIVKEVFEPPVEIEGRPPFRIPVDLKVADRWSSL